MSEPTQDQENVISEVERSFEGLASLTPRDGTPEAETFLGVTPEYDTSPSEMELLTREEVSALLNPEPEPVKVFTEDPVALAQRKRMGTALDNAIKVVEEAGIYGDPDIKAALEVLRANL